MDIQNNSIVTDADTEILDGEINQISSYLSETHYFDSAQEEELEMLVAKAMKLGELYERKKWQAAKAQAIPEGLVVVPKEPTQAMYEAYARHSVAPMSTLSKTGYKAMLEASQEAMR